MGLADIGGIFKNFLWGYQGYFRLIPPFTPLVIIKSSSNSYNFLRCGSRLKISRLKLHTVKCSRLRLSGTGGWGWMGVQRNYILLYES